MVTKTLTIMEDVYTVLLNNKIGGESFSDELRRILSNKKKKKLSDFFGILSKKEGAEMLKSFKTSRKTDMKLDKKREM